MQKEHLRQLVEAGILIYGNTYLAHGGSSSIYVNLRKASGEPSLLKMLAEEIVKKFGEVSEGGPHELI